MAGGTRHRSEVVQFILWHKRNGSTREDIMRLGRQHFQGWRMLVDPWNEASIKYIFGKDNDPQ